MTTAKAIRFEHTGESDVLQFVDHPLPPPGPGEAQVRHTAIGVNFIDIYQRRGLYPLPLPSGLGSEAAGVIQAVGADVPNLKPGDRVAYAGAIGAYSQAANVPVAKLVKLPDKITEEIAAAALLKGMTAQYLLRRIHAVKPGETVLIHSAAGGVGLIACQWAKALGATVIGTVGSEEKAAIARENGCAHVLILSDPDWAAKVRAVTGGAGVPVVYDSVGKDTFDASLNCLAVRGLLVSFGNSSGPVAPFSPSILAAKGSLFVTRPTLAHYVRDATELQETAEDVFSVIASGAVKIAINQRFALKDASKAQDAISGRQTTGATILIP